MNLIQVGNNKTTKPSQYKQMQIMLLPLLLVSTLGTVSLVDASNDEGVSCYDRGYIHGEDHPFNQGTYDRCGDDYYQGFLQGCMSVEGNTRDTCESATDA